MTSESGQAVVALLASGHAGVAVGVGGTAVGVGVGNGGVAVGEGDGSDDASGIGINMTGVQEVEENPFQARPLPSRSILL